MASSWHRGSQRMNSNGSKKSPYGWRVKSPCVCEHCQIPFVEKTWICREGYSYHQECHKCYYCDCKELTDAEIFNGVIFCASCSNKIFHGGRPRLNSNSNGHTNGTSNGHTNGNSSGHSSGSSRRDAVLRDRPPDRVVAARRMWSTKTQEPSCVHRAQYEPSKPIRAIEISDVVKNDDRNNSDSSPNSTCTCSSKIITSTQTGSFTDLRSEKVIVIHEMTQKPAVNSFTGNMTATATVTSEQLSQTARFTTDTARQSTTTNTMASYHHIRRLFESRDKSTQSDYQEVLHKDSVTKLTSLSVARKRKTPNSSRSTKKRCQSKIEDCSDLRMQALGTSTEIANEALLNVEATMSESTVFCPYTPPLERPTELSGAKRQDSELGLLDRRLGSLIKLPFTTFKKNIIERSTLIEAVMYYGDKDDDNSNFLRSVKTLLFPAYEMNQRGGEKKLYKTIRRRQNALKLGWVRESPSEAFAMNSVIRCPHYHKSYSYRCMRRQVMRLAGPTAEQLNTLKANVRELLTPTIVTDMRNLVKNKNGDVICSKCGCEKNLKTSSVKAKRDTVKSLVCAS